RSEVDEVPATQGNLETLVPSKMAEGTSNLFNTLENLGLNTPQNMVRAKKLQAVGVTEENITKVIQNEMNSSTFIQKKILNLDEFKYLNAEQRSAVISAINDGRVDSNGQSITFEQASNIANKIKEKFPNKTIEIWTSDGDVIK
ncbi:hypothetical protein, partial [Paenibacillus macerans]